MRNEARIFVTSFALFLAACGGGGSDSSSSSTSASSGVGVSAGTSTGGTVTVPNGSVPMLPSPTIQVVPTVALYSTNNTVVVPSITNDPATDAFNRTNYYRAMVNLPAYKRSTILDQAALAHTNYLAVNQSLPTEGHFETPGKPAFTGKDPMARAGAAGYPANQGVGENIASNASTFGFDHTDGLFDAPYHRAGQLFGALEAGAGLARYGTTSQYDNYAYTFNFGSVGNVGPSDYQLVAYPYAGQKDVPTSWFANETPNPVPELASQRVGYPIELLSTNYGPLAIASFALSDSKGVPVNVRLVTNEGTEPTRTYAFIVPIAPLTTGSSYTVHATGTLTGKAGPIPFDLSWSFTTVFISAPNASASALSLSSAPGSTLTVTATNTSGRVSGFGSTNYSYIGTIPPPSAKFATFTTISPGVFQFTRTTTPCSTPYANCTAFLTFTDDTGISKQLQYSIK